MLILSIETSCDETAASITQGRRVISNVIFSQVDLHKQWGGVYPSLARREHEAKIDPIIAQALKNARMKIEEVDAIAVTFGPGLVIALEVGVRVAKELTVKYRKPLIPVDHLEGHLYSAFAQNRAGKPARKFEFPFLGLIASGGHTSLVLVKGHQDYEIIGKTLDDALGEALDKAAKILGLGYPGGPIIEELAKKGKPDFIDLPLPLVGRPGLDFSYSGLKTAFRYQVEKMSPRDILAALPHLAASFQAKAFTHLLKKVEAALDNTGLKLLVAGGGVVANQLLRTRLRALAKPKGATLYFPPDEILISDNAAMIGVAAHFKYQNGIYLKGNFDSLDRIGRTDLHYWTTKTV